jgi:hypothetical protein
MGFVALHGALASSLLHLLAQMLGNEGLNNRLKGRICPEVLLECYRHLLHIGERYRRDSWGISNRRKQDLPVLQHADEAWDFDRGDWLILVHDSSPLLSPKTGKD